MVWRRIRGGSGSHLKHPQSRMAQSCSIFYFSLFSPLGLGTPAWVSFGNVGTAESIATEFGRLLFLAAPHVKKSPRLPPRRFERGSSPKALLLLL